MTHASRILLVPALVACLAQANAAEFEVLQHFNGDGVPLGLGSRGPLVLEGATLYGTTSLGGTVSSGLPFGAGTLFSINTNGSGFSWLNNPFSEANGAYGPAGGLVSDGTALYGLTWGGGANGHGGVFTIGYDGAGFEHLHSFSTMGSEGFFPTEGLLLEGTTLYATTEAANAPHSGSGGTVFSIQTDGTGLDVVRRFPGGGVTRGSLVMYDSVLHGMHSGDNLNAWGSSTGGFYSAYADQVFDDNLYHPWIYFVDGGAQGDTPSGGLVVHDSLLYGMTEEGGAHDMGVIMSLVPGDADPTAPGAAFPGFGEVIYDFSGGPDSSAHPVGSLVVEGSTFYGATSSGGLYDLGVLFSIQSDGSEFTALHHFAGGPQGFSPTGDLTLDGSILYGVMEGGGQFNDGTIFAFDLTPVPEPSSIALLAPLAGGFAAWVVCRRRKKHASCERRLACERTG